MYSKGTIVLVPFPFTNLSNKKIRPALIVSKTNKGSDVIMVFITSQSKVSKSKAVVGIKPDKDNGIKTSSHIVCDKLATLDKKIILGELGFISKITQKSVDIELKKVLGL